MHLIFRTIAMFLQSRRRARRGERLDTWDVGRIRLRVLPTDLDVLGHMNNGVYLSIFDLGRFDLLIRNGLWDRFKHLGWYPVVSSESITFRKSLQPWQRFTVETRVTGYDDKGVFIEHRVVVGGEIYTQALVRGRFLKRSGGVVALSELIELTGPAPTDLPAWQAQWARDVALPPTKASAPSDW
ncbi:acyl-CoA thioesterase [Plantibacter cousiniae (nom. nud.)]|uniref:Acyl-CoA thioesterase FadM n=2 Tax=Plantibacter TaxID=190323 RepID=A0ABY1LPH0_9MICO|nr:acyl-CoA thioesterase [Plantibacter cousiniae]SKC66669.1 Acyl-CoA thioesterase FadM [Plantibacter cousiniae]